jgi:hypothetical protein
MAKALVRMGAGDFGAARALLGAIGEHPLKARYMEKADVLEKGAAEVEAEKAWKVIAAVAAKKGPFTRDEALKLASLIKEFEETHGKTKFAESKAKEIADIKDRIERSICYPGVTMFVDSDSKVYEPEVGSWQDVDLSEDQDIPFGATGLVLEIINTDTEKEHIGHTRAAGSKDNRIEYTNIWRRAQVHAFVKIGEEKVFQAYRSNEAIKFFVRGYTGKDVVIFDEPVNKGKVKGGYSDWDARFSTSVAADGVPPNSLAIFDLEFIGGESFIKTCLPDKTCQTYWTTSEPKTHMHVLVPVDDKSGFWWRNGGMTNNNREHHLVGYIQNVGAWLPEKSETILEKAGGWETADLSKILPEDAGVALLSATQGWSTGPAKCDVRMTGSKDDQFVHSHHLYYGGGGRSTSGIFMMIGLDKKRTIEYRTSGVGRKGATSGMRLYVIGYLRRKKD